jgi:hypothetical protein
MQLAQAGQTLVTAEAVSALPKGLRSQTRPVEALAGGAQTPLKVCEALWTRNEEAIATTQTCVPDTRAAAASAEKRLRLRLGDRELILGPERPMATLGRDVNADIVTMDTRASRNHGRIEYRQGKYLLIDQSTNGTYVTFVGEPEFALKREEAILSGRGHVCFGHASGDAPTETLEFEILA